MKEVFYYKVKKNSNNYKSLSLSGINFYQGYKKKYFYEIVKSIETIYIYIYLGMSIYTVYKD